MLTSSANCVASALCLLAVTSAAWAQDPSTRLVRLGRDAHIEVLQWSGPGIPILLLHGAGANANSWRDFAPLLAQRHKVVAISRRGSGTSSSAPAGVTVDTLVRDIAVVLDSLRISAVVALGHSFAGRELTAFGARHGNRLKAIIYFDAAYTANGQSILPKLLEIFATFGDPSMHSADSASADAAAAWADRTFGCKFSVATVRRMWEFDVRGRYRGNRTDSASAERLDKISEPPSYAGFTGPVLALRARWPIPGTPESWTRDSTIAPGVRTVQAILDTVWHDLRADLPQAEYVEIPNANHCMHASRASESAFAILDFIARRVKE